MGRRTVYDWTLLPRGATVVDVGCGLGHVSLQIHGVRPDLVFVLEDRPSVIADTETVRCNGLFIW